MDGLLDPTLLQMPDEERRKIMLANLLLGIGAGLGGARRGNEIGGLAQGAMAGAQMGRQSVEDAQQGKYRQAQINGLQQQLSDKQRVADARVRMSGEIESILNNPTGRMADRSPTVSNASQVPQKWELYEQASQRAMNYGDEKTAEYYAKLANDHRPKWSQTPQQGTDAQGNPYMYVLDQNGNERRLSAGAKPDWMSVDTGGGVQMVNRNQLPVGGVTYNKTLSPEGRQSGEQWAKDYQLRVNADRRAAANADGEGKPQWDAASGQFVYRPSAQNPQGLAVSPQGFSKPDKPLTESQAKATAYANQMFNASQSIAELGDKGFDGTSPVQQGAIEMAGARGIPYVPGTATGPRFVAGGDAQKYHQAELQWTEAALRFMTGANAPEAEVVRNAETYFPRTGDKPEVLQQKAQARRNMEESVRLAAGGGSGQIPSLPPKGKTIVQTGTEKGTGRKVVRYSDGSIAYQ